MYLKVDTKISKNKKVITFLRRFLASITSVRHLLQCLYLEFHSPTLAGFESDLFKVCT